MMAAAVALLERLLFVALAAIVAGRYAVTCLAGLFGQSLFERQIGVGDVTSVAAALLVGVLWLRRGSVSRGACACLAGGRGCRS